MLIDAKYHGDIYEAFLGMEAPVFARAYYQVRSHPNGRKLFKHKPDLLSVLGDVDYLSSLPFGSLGHAYLSFLNTNKLDAGVFGESSIIRPIAEKNNWDDDFYYMVIRGTALHDMFHTIGGYGPDVAGEVANIGFHCGQMEPAGTAGEARTVRSPHPARRLHTVQAALLPAGRRTWTSRRPADGGALGGAA